MTKSSPVARENAQDYLGYLDGIRGGAAFWVLVAHCGIWGGWIRVPDPKNAVDIFMIMSGYLMAYHYMARENKEPVNTWPTAGKFWVRRFFRIAPLYYLIIVTAFLLAPWVREGRLVLQGANPQFWSQHATYDPQQIHYTVTNFFMHVTFLFGLFPQYSSSVFLPDWSIGLEMQFYAVFPLLFLVLRRCGYLLTVLVGLAFTIGTKKWFATLPPFLPGGESVFPEPSFLLLKLPLFLIGMLAAESHRSFSRTQLQRAFSIVLVMFLASRQSVYVLAATALVIYLGASQNDAEVDGVVRWPAFLNRIFANRLTRFMADTSYSVYLIHGTFIALIGGYFFKQPQFVQLAAPIRVGLLTVSVILCSYLTALALYRWVEKPGIQFGRQMIKKIGKRAESQPAPAVTSATVSSNVK